LSDILKRLPISHVIDNNDTMSASIVTCRQCSKSFLSCGIPYL
jgi:hypothetical protein